MVINIISFVVISSAVVLINFVTFTGVIDIIKNDYCYFESEQDKKIIDLFAILTFITILVDYNVVIFMFTLIF